MSNIALLASFSYGDIAIVAVVALGLLIGLATGFRKSFKKSGVVILIASIALCSITANALMNTNMAKSLSSTISDNLAEAGGPAFSEEIYFNETGEPYIKIDVDNNGVEDNVVLKDALKSSDLKWMSFFVNPLIKKVIPEEGGVSFIEKFAPGVANLIFRLVAFILLAIIFKIAIVILNKLYKNFLKDHEYLGPLDRVLGCVYGGGKAILRIFIIFAILQAMIDIPFMAPVKDHLMNSIFCPWVMDSNFVVKLFSSVF